VIKPCIVCGIDFDAKRSAKCCSDACSRRRQQEHERNWRERHPEKSREKTRRSVRQWHERHPERYREQNERRYRANPGKAIAQIEAWKDGNPDKVRAAARRWGESNPDKKAAHLAVRNAITRGELVRLPCSVCGAGDAHAHHPDHSKPLDVMWLCREHHTAEHARIANQRRAERAKAGQPVMAQTA